MSKSSDTTQLSTTLGGMKVWILARENEDWDARDVAAWCVLFPCSGGALGILSCVITIVILSLTVMPYVDPPKYSYGQQIGWISLLFSSAIGFAAGIAFAGFVNGWRRLSSLAMIGVATLGALTTNSAWQNDYPKDCSSAILIFYPVYGYCGVIAIVGMLLFAVSSFTRRANRRQSTEAVNK